jgi:hypothetical protein
MSNLEKIYIEKCNQKSDINEHLPTLKKYAEECNHITELGVREMTSTYALLMGKPKKMISYDVNMCNYLPVQEICKGDTDFQFILGDTRNVIIEKTDLLFIDTLHNYDQISIELSLHSDKVKRYIIIHDTTSFETRGESYILKKVERGIWPAIEEFLIKNHDWILHKRFKNNNGLTILKKI